MGTGRSADAGVSLAVHGKAHPLDAGGTPTLQEVRCPDPAEPGRVRKPT